MLTVLWVIGAAGVVAASALAAGRNAVGATRNRVEWTRARWRALGCARSLQASIDSALGGQALEDGAATWRSLDVLDSAAPSTCDVKLEAAGARLDVNSATVEMLERFFTAAGRSDARQLALDIVAAREVTPIPDVRAFDAILGPDAFAFDSLLSVDAGRVALNAAPSIVLRAIPGFTEEIADAVVAHREWRGPISDLTSVLALVSKTSARELEEHFQEAARVAVADPDAWLLRSSARSGVPPIPAVVEWRLSRQAQHVTIVQSVIR